MKDLWRFVKSSGIYFVGTVLTKLISFLLLPLYTSYISPEGYGTYDLSLNYIMFFCSVLYLDIWSGILRFMYDYTGEDRKKPISSGLAIFFCSTILYCVTLFAAMPYLKLEYPVLLLLYGMLMNFQTLAGYIARGFGRNVLYTSAGIISSLVTVLFNILLLVHFHMDYSALLVASIIGYLVNILIIVIGVREPGAFSLKHFDRKIFKDMLIFSLPLCVNSVAYWFLTSYNRLVVVEHFGPAANGFYAIAGRFGSMVTLFTTCFQMAWQELSFSKTAKSQNLDDFYTTAINNYIKSMGAGLILLIPTIFIIYPLMVNESYDMGKTLVPLYLMGTILSTIGAFLGNAFTAIKKNNLLFWTMLAGSVSNVICMHLLVNRLGIQASNVALMIGFFMTCLTRVILFKKCVRLRVDYKSIAILLLAFLGVWYVYTVGNIWTNLLALLGAVLISVYLFRDVLREMFGLLSQRKKA